MTANPQQLLRSLFQHAVSAVDPRQVGRGHWPTRPRGKLIVLGAGKAAAAMAQAAEAHYGEDLTGLVVTRDGYSLPTRMIEVIEAAHPIPDQRSAAAADRMMALAKSAGPDDLALCLWSGGASALLVAPQPGLSFEEKQNITAALLKSGAAIDEINCVRKHLSVLKGGRLAQMCAPAPVVSMIISDVVGDDPAVIASGPTVADPTTCADALRVLQKYNVPIDASVMQHLRSGTWESPKALTAKVANTIVARPKDCFRAAREWANAQGLNCHDLGDGIDGDVASIAASHSKTIQNIRAGQSTTTAPCVILSGGEAVVKVIGQGRGGPNTELALALALALEGQAGVYALSCDTDGTDGIGGHAGAIITPDTLRRATTLGLNPRDVQARNDTATFFEALGDLVVTGPTFTNVNDFRAVLVL